jgi:hypothetical protein
MWIGEVVALRGLRGEECATVGNEIGRSVTTGRPE